MAQILCMVMRVHWLLDHTRLVAREGSKGPLLVGACDSQPLARESMDYIHA